MSTLVVGLSHRTASFDLLERVTLAPDAVGRLLDDVLATDYVSEALVLSTCNRLEVYAEVDNFHGGVAQVSELVACHGGVDLDELTPHMRVQHQDAAVAHLFSVACGLESMAIGESQVLGQLRGALRVAGESQSLGPRLGPLVQHALRAGKRARTDTGIARAGCSLVTVGLEHATTAIGAPLDGLAVLVVGSGVMGEVAAKVAAQSNPSKIVVANRTFSHAARLATAVGGEAVPLSQLATALIEADLVVCCTGAVGHPLDLELLAKVDAQRAGRPLVILDLALPRDVEPSAQDLESMTVIDLETLSNALATTGPSVDVEAVRAILAEEVATVLGRRRIARVVPTVRALRAMADDVVELELARLAGRLPDLDARSRAEVRRTVSRLAGKLLHVPTVRVKELAQEPEGQNYAEALIRLFDLDLERARIRRPTDAGNLEPRL